MKYRVEHKEAVTEVVVPETVVITLTPEAADVLAVLLAHVQLNSLNQFGLPRPGDLSNKWMALNDAKLMRVRSFVDGKWALASNITIAFGE